MRFNNSSISHVPGCNSTNFEGGSMEVYCTRPGCENPRNSIADECLNTRTTKEILCEHCGMPLILQGNFIATEVLGSGGFGRTFKAKDLDFRHTIRVIKQLYPTTPHGKILNPKDLRKIERMFEDEAITLDRLQHPRIPKFLAFFTMELEDNTGYVQKLFYLVQDYIEGKDLAQELRHQDRFSEDEVITILKEILNILKYLHNHEGNNKFIYIHRDIKPANIIRSSQDGKLYLIDFGAVKQILEGLEVETTSIVLDRCFAPPEQFRGQKLSPASDLYATATTCVSLLTGNTNPNELIEEADFKEIVQVRDQRFAKALEWMLQFRLRDRPQSAQDVLDILAGKRTAWLGKLWNKLKNYFDDFTKFFIRWKWTKWIIFTLLGVAIAVILLPYLRDLNIFKTIPSISQSASPTPNTLSVDAQYFSRGEDILISPNPQAISASQECQTAYDYKKKGTAAFAIKDFSLAERYFSQANQQFKAAAVRRQCEVDPETLIYEFNAKVAQSNPNLPTIAVVITGDSKQREITLEVLRGVAQSLNTEPALFQIIIADENPDKKPINTEKIAQYISQNNIPGDINFQSSTILGVIGHSPSKNTWKAGEIYGAEQLNDKEKLVVISPTSTAIRKPNLTNPNNDLNPYVFRTASNDEIAAGDLAKYMWEVLALRKAMIVYDPNDAYSDSLRREFNNYLIRRQINPNNHIQYCNLIKEQPDICIQKAKTIQAQGLILFPSRDALNAAIEMMRLGNQEFKMLGGDILYDGRTLNLKEAAKGMIVAVFSHIEKTSPQFTQKAQDIGWLDSISWRSISAYDATQALVKALTELSGNGNITRQDIYNKLKETNFAISGATNAVVSFKIDGDRKLVTGVGVLVQVDKINSDEYGFKLLETPNR